MKFVNKLKVALKKWKRTPFEKESSFLYSPNGKVTYTGWKPYLSLIITVPLTAPWFTSIPIKPTIIIYRVCSQKLLVKLPDLSQTFRIIFIRFIYFTLAVTETRNKIITPIQQLVNIFCKLKTDSNGLSVLEWSFFFYYIYYKAAY